MIAAIDSQMYDGGANCGKQAKVTRKDDPSKSVTVVSIESVVRSEESEREDVHTVASLPPAHLLNLSPLTLLFPFYLTRRQFRTSVQLYVSTEHSSRRTKDKREPQN